MAAEVLKNELNELLENAQSIQSLEPMKRGELKDKLLSLPDKQVRQVIEQLKDEREKLKAVAGEITRTSMEAKNEAKTLHSLMLNEQRKNETMESKEKSEKILHELKNADAGSESKKNGRGILIAVVVISVGTVMLLLKYFNYF